MLNMFVSGTRNDYKIETSLSTRFISVITIVLINLVLVIVFLIFLFFL